MYSSNYSHMMALSLKPNNDKLTGLLLNDLRLAWHLLYWAAGFLVLLKIFSGNEKSLSMVYIGQQFLVQAI